MNASWSLFFLSAQAKALMVVLLVSFVLSVGSSPKTKDKFSLNFKSGIVVVSKLRSTYPPAGKDKLEPLFLEFSGCPVGCLSVAFVAGEASRKS
jgi:hypothetical protein